MTEGYGDDLAYVHDAGFGTLAEQAADELLARLARAGIRQGRVVDLGAGSGLLAARVTAAGYQCLGIEQSAALVALARARAPRAEFRQASLWRAALPRAVAITATGECFNYLFSATTMRPDFIGLFRRVARALEPGGWFLFDVAGPGRVPPPGTLRVGTVGPDWAVVMLAEEDRAARRLTRRITTFRQVGDAYRRTDETHLLELVPPGEVLAALTAAGLRGRRIGGYGSLAFPRGWAGFVARKADE